MARYILKGDGPLLHDGREYRPGETVEMDSEMAARFRDGRLEANAPANEREAGESADLHSGPAEPEPTPEPVPEPAKPKKKAK